MLCFVINDRGEIMSVNKFCADELGYKVGQLVGKQVNKVIPVNDRKKVKNLMKDFFKNGKSEIHHKFHLLSRDGTRFLSRNSFHRMHDPTDVKKSLVIVETIDDKLQNDLATQTDENVHSGSKEKKIISVALITSSPIFVEGIQKILEDEKDIDIVAVASDKEGFNFLIVNVIHDVLIVDTSSSKLEIEEIQEPIKEKNLKTEVLLVLRNLDDEIVINALSLGVKGFLTNNTKAEKLIQAIRFVNKEEIWGDLKIMKKIITRFVIIQKGKPFVFKNILTNKEQEITNLIADGLSNKVIAQKLFICEKTVKTHLTNIYRKLGVNSRLQLAKKFQN